MINAGTNDCIQNIDVDNAGKRMKAMLDLLKKEIPETTILLSTIVPSASRQSCVDNVNRQFKGLKDEANGIYIAEMQLTMSDITNDGM